MRRSGVKLLRKVTLNLLSHAGFELLQLLTQMLNLLDCLAVILSSRRGGKGLAWESLSWQ